MGFSNKTLMILSLFLAYFFSNSFRPLFADINYAAQLLLNPPPPPPPPLPVSSPDDTPFKTSIAIIVAVLTTMFSVTFLLLLYAKHCKRGNGNGSTNSHMGYDPNSRAARKHSGIERSVIESLPIFRFNSLRGQKEGLECAVCLTRFEPTEVLRLLPKCKHAFHVECVDTWLDAHSTCPLCRYRVDPEDILLIGNDVNYNNADAEAEAESVSLDIETGKEAAVSPGFRRFSSGRHSSAGEKVSSWLQHKLGVAAATASFRRSLDGSRKNNNNNIIEEEESSSASLTVGCFFDRPTWDRRRDGQLLLSRDNQKRLEHRIIVSGDRWSDVQPSDLLYLRSEMILSDSRRLSSSQQHEDSGSSSRPPAVNLERDGIGGQGHRGDGTTSVINSRSVSEITGLNRFASNTNKNSSEDRGGQAAGVVSRWLAWVSSLSHPAARSERAAPASPSYS